MGYHSALGGEGGFLELPVCAPRKGAIKKKADGCPPSAQGLLRTLVSPQSRAGGKENSFVHL